MSKQKTKKEIIIEIILYVIVLIFLVTISVLSSKNIKVDDSNNNEKPKILEQQNKNNVDVYDESKKENIKDSNKLDYNVPFEYKPMD